MSEQAEMKGKNHIRKLWVPLVLIVGFLIGESISYVSSASGEQRRGPFGHFPEHFSADPLFGLHIVFTTIEVALLVSLAMIYIRTYAETRARFALGLVVVLGAFLLQALLSYPLVAGLLGPVNMGQASLAL